MHLRAGRCAVVSTVVGMLGVGSVASADRGDIQPVSDDGVWASIDADRLATLRAEPWVRPLVFRAVTIDKAALDAVLAQAPLEHTEDARAFQPEIYLPMPDGTYARFRFVESLVMAPGLAAKFPEIRTYLGQGVDDPAVTVRFDWTEQGFHAQILSPEGAVYIDPYNRGDTTLYSSYYLRDAAPPDGPFMCGTQELVEPVHLPDADEEFLRIGETLRTYRLAVAATGEYTDFHGGTVSQGLSAITTVVNRVTGILELEVAVRLELIANNNLIVYTDGAIDPYSNGSPGTMLGENTTNLNTVIGSANYEQGHVFGTIGGGFSGVASLGVICTASKARGVSTSSNPNGDGFSVRLVAHEMGHQFGASHTWNGVSGSCSSAGQWSGAHSFEPGSGSTIMAYTGICNSDNIQSFPDTMYSHESIRQIRAHVSTGSGSSCPATSATGNQDPTVSAGADYTIPHNTPFALTAVGSDPDLDAITYSWEQRDLGSQTALATPDDGQIPLFRVWPPTTDPVRTFPRLSNLLNNTLPLGEQMPVVGRDMDFRVQVRDNVAGGGGTAFDDMVVTVDASSGPFVVTSPNTGVAWSGVRTVTWDVANTDIAPVDTPLVDILLSTDGGNTFSTTLRSGAPNDGSQAVVIPNTPTSQARIKVQGTGNIFFDLSNVNFTIGAAPPLAVLLPDGPPTHVAEATASTFNVEIVELAETLVGGTETLHYRFDGGTFLTAPLTPLGGDLYEASLPGASCSDAPEFYVSGQASGGSTITDPAAAPGSFYTANVGEFVAQLTENFAVDAGSFTYSDGTFRGTEDPDAFVDGSYDGGGGQTGGGLRVDLGVGPGADEMSGGWSTDVTVPAGGADVRIDFAYRLFQSERYESNEISEALLSIDGVLVGLGGNDYLAQFVGDGNSIGHKDTGWRSASIVATLGAGTREIIFGGYNNASTEATEYTEVYFDDITISVFECTPSATVDSVTSLADHGGTELGLDLQANNIEPRDSGVTKLEVGLTGTAGSVSTVVSCVNNVYSDSITTTALGSTVTVEFGSALPDQDCCDVTLSGDVADVIQVRTLAGDIDRNGTVTTADASIIKSLFNGDPAVDGAEFDFNVDGVITTADFSQVKPLFNNTAPACP